MGSALIRPINGDNPQDRGPNIVTLFSIVPWTEISLYFDQKMKGLTREPYFNQVQGM